MLKIKKLKKIFPNGVKAIREIDLNIEAGEFVTILGPSGSGKTTLLRSINGLETIDSGQILFQNQIISEKSLPNIQKKTGMIFQEFNLVNNISVINNVLSGLLHSSSRFLSMFYIFEKKQKLAALEALDTVGLLNKAYSLSNELSGGQRQRVGIARAIVKKPLLLLADEPVASLDPVASISIMNLLSKINKVFKITVMCNLHQTDLALKYSDRIVGINNGIIVFNKTNKQLDQKSLKKIFN